MPSSYLKDLVNDDLINQAATIRGCHVKDFIHDVVIKEAKRVVEQNLCYEMNEEDCEAFWEAYNHLSSASSRSIKAQNYYQRMIINADSRSHGI